MRTQNHVPRLSLAMRRIDKAVGGLVVICAICMTISYADALSVSGLVLDQIRHHVTPTYTYSQIWLFPSTLNIKLPPNWELLRVIQWSHMAFWIIFALAGFGVYRNSHIGFAATMMLGLLLWADGPQAGVIGTGISVLSAFRLIVERTRRRNSASSFDQTCPPEM